MPASLTAFPRPAAYLISHTRRFEVADLFSFLMGSRARIIYTAVLSGYMYGALWAYGTVFASSFAANVPVAFFNSGQACAILEHGVVNSACLGTFYTWLGVFAPAATPAPVVLRLSREVAQALRQPALRERMEALGYEVVGSTPEEFAALQRAELPRVTELVRLSGATVE
jgi:hypothetical protein